MDDGLTSVPSAEEAVSLLKITQMALKMEGNIRLHKNASNDSIVLNSFQREDFGKKKIVSHNLDKDVLPVHQSWDLESDSSIFDIQIDEKPNTKRGFLSMLNSVYDPLGFVDPILIN